MFQSLIILRFAKINIFVAMVIPALIGVVIALIGVDMEAYGQGSILAQGGGAALRAYNVARYAVPGDWCVNGLLGRLPSFGINTYIRGAVLSIVAPLVSAATILLSRRVRTK